MSQSANSKEPVEFTPEQNEAIRKGFEGLAKGEGMSAEEAHELARKRTKAWMQAAPQNLSA